MKILKEDVSDLNYYKKAYGVLTHITESDFKKLVSKLASLSPDKNSKSDIKSNNIKKILTLLAEIANNDKKSLPKKQCKFLTNYYDMNKKTFDFNKLVKDSNFNLLRVRGMIATLIFKSVLRNQETYYRFLSLFSPKFPGERNVIPNDLSFIILNSFAEAFGIDNISNTNKFIKDYLNNTYFINYTPTREVFEKVYNDYVSNPSFDVKKIFGGDNPSKEDNKEIII